MLQIVPDLGWTRFLHGQAGQGGLSNCKTGFQEQLLEVEGLRLMNTPKMASVDEVPLELKKTPEAITVCSWHMVTLSLGYRKRSE